MIEKKTLDNGIVIEKEDDRFFVVIDTERLEISRTDVVKTLYSEGHDYIFNVIINAKRKYTFNTAMDRYSPDEY